MRIFLLLGTVLQWAISSRELIRINFRLTLWNHHTMGLKVEKWLNNSQFELREESYFFKKKSVEWFKNCSLMFTKPLTRAP